VSTRDWSAQGLAAALALSAIAPNALTAVVAAVAITRDDSSDWLAAGYVWAAAVYAAFAVLAAVMAFRLGRRLPRAGRRLLVGAGLFSAAAAIAGAALRLQGPLPPLLRMARESGATIVQIAAGLAVVHLCAAGFRRALGLIATSLSSLSLLLGVAELFGLRVPLTALADLGGLLVAVVALSFVPRS